MFARPPLATLHALAALAIVSLSTGCTVVGLQVQNLSARQGEARNLAAHNGDDRAAALLKQAVGRGVGETDGQVFVAVDPDEIIAPILSA